MPSDNFAPSSDGYVRYAYLCPEDADPTFVDHTNLFVLRASTVAALTPGDTGPGLRRAYFFADTSSLPAGATITKVELTLFWQSLTDSSRDTIFYQQASQYSSYGTAEDLFNGLDDGSVYVQGLYTAALDTPIVVDLGSQAITDLQGHLTWFGVGILIDESSPPVSTESKVYYSNDSDTTDHNVRPYLTVTYTQGNRRRAFNIA
jgi:hypothetical protein